MALSPLLSLVLCDAGNDHIIAGVLALFLAPLVT